MPHTQGSEEREQLAQVRRQLVMKAVELLNELDTQRIANAPLNQWASALSAIIDKLIKLIAQSESMDAAANQERQVMQIEYVYPDGTTHRAPPWADQSIEGEDAVLRGGVRAALGQDGTGEDSTD